MKQRIIHVLLLSLLTAGCGQQDDESVSDTTAALPGYALPDYALTDDTLCRQAFVDYMNRRAVLLGMHHTHFVDASGLVADGSAITAHDAVLLALKAQSLPPIALVWGQRRHAMRVGGADARTDTIGSLDKAVFTERHRLLGCKTGTLARQAGVVLICEGAGGQRYVAAVLGSVREQRWRDARRLIDLAERRSAHSGSTVSDRDLRAQGAAVCLLPEVYVPWTKATLPHWLYQRQADMPLLPASVTKTMTAICMLDFVDNLDEPFTIVESDIRSGNGPRLKAGDVLTYREALYAMFLPSSNTAAVAVARCVGRKMLQSGRPHA